MRDSRTPGERPGVLPTSIAIAQIPDMVMRMNTSPLFLSFPARRTCATLFAALVCMTAYGETPCPGYVETDAGSAFDLASMIKDSGSPQSTLARVRGAVSKIDAGGGRAIFSDVRA